MPGPCDATMIIVCWPSRCIIGNPEIGIASHVISGCQAQSQEAPLRATNEVTFSAEFAPRHDQSR